MQGSRVAIVGGGPGGLMTAHALDRDARSPFEITIDEASGRLGGKVLTQQFDRLPARYEAGAAEFYDYSVVGPDPLRDLVHDCGLSVVPMGGSALFTGGRVIANVDDARDVPGREAAAAMAGHVVHYDHPAHYLRITVLFDARFWRPRLADSFVMLDAFGGCCLYDESSRVPEATHGTLGWLLGGAAAEEMSRLDDEALVTAALDSAEYVAGWIIDLFDSTPGAAP